MTFTEAAAEVLRLVGKPLHYKDITELAIQKNLLSHVGKSPEVTMGSRLAALLKKSPKENPLVRMKPGVFALRAWEDTGPPGPPPEVLEAEAAAAAAAAAAKAAPAARPTRASAGAEPAGTKAARAGALASTPVAGVPAAAALSVEPAPAGEAAAAVDEEDPPTIGLPRRGRDEAKARQADPTPAGAPEALGTAGLVDAAGAADAVGAAGAVEERAGERPSLTALEPPLSRVAPPEVALDVRVPAAVASGSARAEGAPESEWVDPEVIVDALLRWFERGGDDEAISARAEARPPRDEARPPRDEAGPARDEKPRGEARPPRDEARPPHSEARPPHGEARPPR
ncbi:MAG TPA: winged helix-turn-helix domain-containing protein, partial [Polyangiaceae bacterium]|nr:winged helix-turn-helix domain-containing protein [Polyangiaceae bacterium]